MVKQNIQVPQIIIEDIAIDAFAEEFSVNPIKAEDISEPLFSREEKIKKIFYV